MDIVSDEEDERVLKMEGGDGCTIMWRYFMPFTEQYIKNVYGDNFLVICMFYHNKKYKYKYHRPECFRIAPFITEDLG